MLSAKDPLLAWSSYQMRIILRSLVSDGFLSRINLPLDAFPNQSLKIRLCTQWFEIERGC